MLRCAIPMQPRQHGTPAHHTSAGVLTAATTGLSARAAAILDANIEAAAAAMAKVQVERYARAQRQQARADDHCGGQRASARDRLARMIAPGGGGVTVRLSSSEQGVCARGSTPPATPPPSAREIQERESRRHAFLHKGVATGGSILKAARRPATLGRAATYAQLTGGAEELEFNALRRRLIGGDGSASSSPSSSPASSPRVKPMLTTADGRQVYIAAEPLEVPSSSDEGDDGTTRGLVLDEPWEVLDEDGDGAAAGSGSSEMSSPGMFGEGERALYSLYMEAISHTDTSGTGSNTGEEEQEQGVERSQEQTGQESTVLLQQDDTLAMDGVLKATPYGDMYAIIRTLRMLVFTRISRGHSFVLLHNVVCARALLLGHIA